MATPILTVSQQRKSLSGKKVPVKGLKNVLAQPQESQWPKLQNDQQAAEVEDILNSLLPQVKRPNVRIPWSKQRQLTKEQRSAARKNAQSQCENFYNEEASKSIVFGINVTTRLLEKNDCSLALLDSTVEPALLIKHIIIMGKDQKVPVFVVPFLKKVTLNTIGFDCAAIGLKKIVQESRENYFYPLFDNLSKLAPMSEQLTENDQQLQKKLVFSPKKQVQSTVDQSQAVPQDLYLYRTSNSERVFIPPNAKVTPRKEKGKWEEFIAVNHDDGNVPLRFFPNNVEEGKSDLDDDCAPLYNTRRRPMGESNDSSNEGVDLKKVEYQPLKVKRLKGNESRAKNCKPPKLKKKKKK